MEGSQKTYRYNKTTKVKSDYSLNPMNKQLSTADLQAIHRRLAKATNQRMVRLERATSEVTGESFAGYGAYPLIKDYLDQQGRKRFSESPKLDIGRRALQKEIAQMQNFLNSKSSTVSGQREVERDRMKTFEQEHFTKAGRKMKGLKFASNAEFYNFFKTEAFKKLSKAFNSEKVLEEYDSLVERLVTERDKIDEMFESMTPAQIKEWKKQHKYRRLSDESILKKAKTELENYRKSVGSKNWKNFKESNRAVTLYSRK